MEIGRETQPFRGLVCDFPFWRFEIHMGGKVFHCCPTWLPTPIGNIRENSILELIETETSKKIREAMADGSFRYCEKELCPYLSQYLSSGHVRAPLYTSENIQSVHKSAGKRVCLMLNYDRSCNLYCVSCRNELLVYAEDKVPAEVRAVHEATLKNIRELLAAGYQVHINVTGSGDAFASPLYRKFLMEFESHPQLHLEIQTNGIQMDERHFSKDLRALTTFLAVSVDASTEATYEKVRRGGNFQSLLRNLEWVDQEIRAGHFPRLGTFKLNFIVQDTNYKEIVSFVDLFNASSSVQEIWFNLIADWGHLPGPVFAQRAVWQTTHPEHQEFCAEVRKLVERRDARVNVGNLSSYVN